jgi:hypothetical protein
LPIAAIFSGVAGGSFGSAAEGIRTFMGLSFA